MADRNEGEVQQYLATPELVGFTRLVEDLIMQMNAVKLEEVKGIVNQYRARIETLINTTPADEVITAMNSIKPAILNKGGSIVVSNPTWDDIIAAINSIPSEYFTKPKFPEIKTYGIPEAQISWGDNVANAYRTAKEFQEMMDDNDGIHGQERTYKGFYMIEYSPSIIPAKSTKTKTLTFTTTVDKNSTDCNGNGFLIGLKERRFLEFSDYELSQGIVTKQFEFTLDEIPDDGKLFIFFLFEKDEYNAKTPVSNANYGYFGEGKLLVIGGHPYKFWCPSGVKFDEGIIQLNRTGEQVDTTIPSAIAGSDGKGTDYVGSFICIEDYEHEEEQLTFTGDVYFSNDTSVHYDGSSFTDDYIQTGGSHFEYIAFPNAVRFENFKVEDRYHTILESCYVDDEEVLLDSYKLILDVDGYSLLDASGNFKTFDHPGTDFTIDNNVDANDIYLRQARGKFNAHDSGYIDKIHLPELVEHGLVADGATSDATYIAANDGDLYELELPALETVTAGGVVNNCDKLHELTLPKLETNNGTIATGCDNLYKLSLPNLKTSTGTIVSGCPKLSVLEGLDKVVSATGYTTCANIENVKEFPFINLKIAKSQVWFDTNIKTITFPELEEYSASGYTSIVSGNLEELHLPKLERCTDLAFGSVVGDSGVPNLKVFDAPKLKYWYFSHNFGRIIKGAPTLEQLIIGKNNYSDHGAFIRIYETEGAKLIDIHFITDETGGINMNYDMRTWKPREALDSTSTSLVHDGEPFQNNKEKFLYNLKYHTLSGFYDRVGHGITSKLTLTLSNVIEIALTEQELLEIDEIAASIGWSIAYA